MNRSRILLILAILAILFMVPLGRTFMYTVDERELAVITQFGEPVASRTEPGLYFKMPFIQQVRRLPKTLQFWHGAEKLVDVPTADGKKIEVSAWAAWKITDPIRFVQTLRNIENAESRVTDFVRSSMRDTLTRSALYEIVRSTDRTLTHSFVSETLQSADADIAVLVPHGTPSEPVKLGREQIMEQIKRDAQTALAQEGDGDKNGRGIELVDVGISRIEFVPTVRDEAFNRQIAAMEAVASKAISEGQRRKQEILNRTQAEIQKIEGEGSQEASIIKGKVDAEIIESYARAIEKAGEFYRFVRTLEAYKTALSGDTRLILSTNSDMFRLLKNFETPTESGGQATASTE